MRNIALVVLHSASLILCIFNNKAFAIDTDIHFWFKAFIPNTELVSSSDYITKTTSGSYAIPAPMVPAVSQGVGSIPSYSEEILNYYNNTIRGTCFETDNRSFNKDPNAPARVTVEFLIKVRGREIELDKANGRSMARIGPTRQINCKTGSLIGEEKSTKTSSIKISKVEKNGFFRIINVAFSSHNPFYSLIDGNINIAPSIDASFVIKYDPLRARILIDGNTGIFPAFEFYSRTNNHEIKNILLRKPESGATAASLIDLGIGINTKEFSSTINILE